MGKHVAGPPSDTFRVDQDTNARPKAERAVAPPDKRGYTDDPVDQLMKRNVDSKRAARGEAIQQFGSAMRDASRDAANAALANLRSVGDQPMVARGTSVPELRLPGPPTFKRGGVMKKSGRAKLHRGEKAVRSKGGRR